MKHDKKKKHHQEVLDKKRRTSNTAVFSCLLLVLSSAASSSAATLTRRRRLHRQPHDRCHCRSSGADAHCDMLAGAAVVSDDRCNQIQSSFLKPKPGPVLNLCPASTVLGQSALTWKSDTGISSRQLRYNSLL